MKQYTFQMTKKEIWKFCIRAVWEQQRLRFGIWVLVVIICILDILLLPWAGIAVLLASIMMMAVNIFWNYSVMKKALYEKQRTMWVENGMLKVKLDVYGEVPLRNIQVIRTTRNLLMLGHYQAKKHLVWYPMPLRVFETSQEQEAFLEQIRHPQQEAFAGEAAFKTEEADKELFHFSYWMEEEKWIGLSGGVAEIIYAGTFGKSKKRGAFFAVYGVFFVLLVCSFYLLDNKREIMTLFFILTLVFLALLKAIMENPKKRMRRQMKSGIFQRDVFGEWTVMVTENGVIQVEPCKGKNVFPWETLGWLVETDIAFYLFGKDKRHYIMIPKECIETYEQAEALCRLCVEKNVFVLQGRKMKYVPDWVFYILIAAITVGYLFASVLFAVRDVRKDAAKQIEDSYDAAEEWTENTDTGTTGWMDDFNPADYPDYVPLEEQVKVLRSFGFTLPQEMVESVRSSMEEYGLHAMVEGYPYTWLLTEIGMPLYNEEWKITDYSDEVFWFDFEGLDISTDYIVVLEGMRALASGSTIDEVQNLKENIDDVDWEKGTGKVLVSFVWKEKEYSWQMDVQYDWLDEEVLGIYNSLLKQDGAAERFYVTGDNGQGALVFFCTQEWAEKFEKATGLELDYDSSHLSP